MSEQAVLDIPDIRTLEYSTAEDEVRIFTEAWGIRPECVALPVILPYGIPFENQLVAPSGVRYGGATSDVYLGGVAHEFAKLGLNIILTVVPTMSFARSSALHVIDISGDGSTHACLAKAATQRLLSTFVGEAVEKVQAACKDISSSESKNPTLVGIALDIENLWPMSASNERVELTCFCEECRQQLASVSKMGKKLVPNFERFPNPWNLLLRDSGSGVGPIDDIDWETTPKAVVDLSHLKAFDEVLVKSGADLLAEASLLLEYMHTRHKQTLQSVGEFFDSVLPSGGDTECKRILMVEESAYDWTAGVFFKRLDNRKVCDELWFDPSELALNTSNIPHRAYMHRRCRYTVNAFFEHLHRCQDEYQRTTTGLSRLSDDRLRASLQPRRRQAVSTRLTSKLDLFCLHPIASEDESGRVGFVANNLSDEMSTTLVKGAKLVSAAPDQIEANENNAMDALRAILGKGV